MSKINIGDHPKIKHTLGLSSKSIIHNWDTIAAKGEVPELGKRISQAAKMAKGASAVGWLAIGVDGLIAADNIKEACTGNDTSQCEVVSYKEAGRFAGGVAIVAIGFLGAGAGAYVGSKAGDSGGEAFGEMVYQKKMEYFK